MTYIGSVTESDKSMSDERRMEQERIQGFCQDQAANFRWRTDYCQSQVNQALAPYLVVPRAAQPAPLVRTEVEILRERVAAMEAQIASLAAPEPSPPHHPMARAVSRWPGSQGFIQGIRWRGAI